MRGCAAASDMLHPLPGWKKASLCWPRASVCQHPLRSTLATALTMRVLRFSRELAVCRSVISQIDATITKDQREDVEKVEKVMRTWCDSAKGKDKTMCYYMGVGDAEQVRRPSNSRQALARR